MRCVGVDPGSKSWDFFGIEEENGLEIFLDHSVQTKRIQKNPQIFMEVLKTCEPFELLSAPSGFGLPLKKIEDMTEEDFFLTILKKKVTKEKS